MSSKSGRRTHGIREVEIAYPVGICYCGCGTPTKKTTMFFAASGHDKTATTNIIREFYGDVASFVLAHQGPPE